MSEQRTGPYWEALRLATEGAPAEVFLAKAREAKEDITDAWYELWRKTNVLDNLVADLAPKAEWTAGADSSQRDSYGRPAGQPTAPQRKDRSDRIIEIAEGVIQAGEPTVETGIVVDTLRREGYEGEPRNLAVSVGNVLARAGDWRRVRAGVYAPIE